VSNHGDSALVCVRDTDKGHKELKTFLSKFMEKNDIHGIRPLEITKPGSGDPPLEFSYP